MFMVYLIIISRSYQLASHGRIMAE